MRFRWVPLGAGRSCPLLQVGIRRNGLALPADPLLLVDTGADGTLLHLQMAKFLGFQDADLVTEESGAADGTMTVSDTQGPRERGGLYRGPLAAASHPKIRRQGTDVTPRERLYLRSL